MGKKGKTQENSNSREKKQEELLKTLGDFTSKDNWDQFFSITGNDDSFEWYAEWPQLQSLLTAQLVFPSSVPKEPSGAPPPAVEAAEVSILVPGCGNSRLSEHLYDVGFRNITNVDFSKVVISDMLRRNVRERPMMKWRVMDMTNMQFASETFDAIIDKGGLDALMEPKLGPSLGNLYLSEVKRLLKAGGKFICLTLAESHVLDLLFAKFRFGWKMSLYAISMEPSSRNSKLQTFIVVAEKDFSTVVSEISSFLDEDSVDSHSDQVRKLCEALEREIKVRSEYSNGADILYPLEDLNLGAKGNLTELEPGRRIKIILGEPGVSSFFYNAVLLDAQRDSGPFTYQFAAFIVSHMRADEWLFSSEEGQWIIVENSKAARLVMILLDSSNAYAPMEDIQMDLSPLVKQLTPGNCDDTVPIPFMAAGDTIKQRHIVHQLEVGLLHFVTTDVLAGPAQPEESVGTLGKTVGTDQNKVTSALTGTIIVDDVVYEKIDDAPKRVSPTKDVIYRRLVFQRSESLVQSEALLSTEGPNEISNGIENNKMQAASKTRKKGKQKKNDSVTLLSPAASRAEIKVNHNHLASSYHNGIIAGLLLISLHLKGSTSAEGMVKTVVMGLGAGVLPMFMRNYLPSLEIEVVELDPVILNVARDYFGFRDDERLKVHLGDGIRYVKKKADSESEKKDCPKIDILIVDVDSSDPSSGLTCPEAGFVEESFLSAVKNTVSEQGLFIVNLVSRSSAMKSAIYSRMKMVFSNMLSLKLEEDVNEVIFAVNTETPVKEDQLSEAREALARKLKQEKQEWSEWMIAASKNIKPLE